MITRVAKNTVKSEILIENEKAYLYKSVTPYDNVCDHIEYVVTENSGMEHGRYLFLESAIKVFAQL
jgi:hypothetical protein